MIRIKYIFLSFVWVASALGADAQKENEFYYFDALKHGQTADIQVSGKAREYYSLSGKAEIEISVNGPSQLKVVSRLGLGTPDKLVHYRFFAKRDNQDQTIVFEEQAKAVDGAKLVGANGGWIGAADQNIIDIPRGTHSYKFYLPKNSEDKVYLRFATNWVDSVKLAKRVNMSPVEITTKVELISNDKSSTYYRVGKTDKLSLKVEGPVSLKGFCRIEFDSTMTGEQKWRLQVLEDGKMKATYPLASRKSQFVTYSEPNNLVPSNSQAFFVEVPAGEHIYEFALPESNRTALIKFSVFKNGFDPAQ